MWSTRVLSPQNWSTSRKRKAATRPRSGSADRNRLTGLPASGGQIVRHVARKAAEHAPADTHAPPPARDHADFIAPSSATGYRGRAGGVGLPAAGPLARQAARAD